jgi:beta-glucosidase
MEESFEDKEKNNLDKSKTLTFPSGFLWGTAVSSHQIEGDNKNNDWWRWEENGKTKDKSGKACDSYNRFREDNQLAKELNCNALRLSLEWSRIEPEEGNFSKEAIDHYRNVLQDIKNKGMKRILTFNHWTLPLWFADGYGWDDRKAPEIFSNYCEKIIQELGAEIDLIITLNEPTIPLNKGYLVGIFPPGKKSPLAFWRARKNMIRAHRKCYDLVKKYYPNMQIGITQYCNTFEVEGLLRIFTNLLKRFQIFYNWGFMKKDFSSHDFIGVDYYATFVFSLKYPFFRRETMGDRWTDMKWGIYPEGLYDVCMEASHEFKKPIYIFENGLADEKDKYRSYFIKKHLYFVKKAIDEGADIRGYFYWSLLDNFEWNQGFWPRFGLVEIDFETQVRHPRKSFDEYAKICKNNEVEIRG